MIEYVEYFSLGWPQPRSLPQGLAASQGEGGLEGKERPTGAKLSRILLLGETIQQ